MSFILDTLRRDLANRPLWLFFVLAAPLWILARRRIRLVPPGATDVAVRAVCLGAIVYYAGVTIWYWLVPQQVDAAEPSVTAAAWLFAVGKPVYHAIDSPARYSHMYGPMAFIVPGLVLRLAGPSMLAAKGVGCAAALLAVGLMWHAIRAFAPARAALLVLGLALLEFLCFRNLTFWSRPEPLQLLMVAAGLAAAARAERTVAVAVAAVAVGVLCNLKITGLLYALPVFGLLHARAGARAVCVSAAAAAVVAAAPFALANVSWSNYLLWIQLSAKNGLRLAALKENVEWALFILLPVLVSLGARQPLTPALRAMLPALVAAMCGVIIAAAKPGAGPYHLLPFIPSVAIATAMLLGPKGEAGPVWTPAFLLTLVCIAGLQQQYFLGLARDEAVTASYRDVASYLDQHPGERVGMGYTSAERMTFARTLVVFRTGEYLLDVPAMQEYQLSGIALPPSTIAAIRTCAIRTWLLPRTGEPFRIQNDYPTTAYRQIFPPEFIEQFVARYELTGRHGVYDVWQCQGPA